MLQNDSTIPALDITVAIELEYILRNDFDYENDLHIDDEYIQNIGANNLPFGTRRDVVKEFRLLAGWPALRQEAITDTVHYSDLDPYAAPRWRASVTFHKGVQGLLRKLHIFHTRAVKSGHLLDAALTRAKMHLVSTDETPIKDKIGPKPTGHRTAADVLGPVLDSGSPMHISIGTTLMPIKDVKLKEIISSVFNVNSNEKIVADSATDYHEIYKDCEVS